MKTNLGLVRKRVAGVAVLTLILSLAPAQAQKEIPVAGKVIRLTGHARYSTDRQTWKTLKKGATLKAPVVIQTAPNSVVDLCLNERRLARAFEMGPAGHRDNVIRLFQNSALAVDKLAAEPKEEEMAGEIQLDLRSGQMMGTVGKLSAASRYEIRLANGVAGVRAGTFIADSTGVVNVIRGSVAVVIAGADGKLTTRFLKDDQGLDPATGLVNALTAPDRDVSLTCDEITSEPSNASGPAKPIQTNPNGMPRGPGMGGSLRKF